MALGFRRDYCPDTDVLTLERLADLGAAEIYMGIAGVFRRFGRQMQVVDTNKERDVDISHDFFTPMMKKESKGIMVKLVA